MSFVELLKIMAKPILLLADLSATENIYKFLNTGKWSEIQQTDIFIALLLSIFKNKVYRN